MYYENLEEMRKKAIQYVKYVVDNSLSGRELGADPHACIRQPGQGFKYASVLVGWQVGFEPVFVAVHSYLDTAIDGEEAEELATDYLTEINFKGFEGIGQRIADYVIYLD